MAALETGAAYVGGGRQWNLNLARSAEKKQDYLFLAAVSASNALAVFPMDAALKQTGFQMTITRTVWKDGKEQSTQPLKKR